MTQGMLLVLASFVAGLVKAQTGAPDTPCPDTHPQYGCGRCWVDWRQARDGGCSCDGDLECGHGEFCARTYSSDANGNSNELVCGTVPQCRAAGEHGAPCTASTRHLDNLCEEKGCGFNLYCQAVDETYTAGTCEYVNRKPFPCFTGRCGTKIEHESSGPSDDGCNTCFCNNGVLSCTEKACIGVPEKKCDALKVGDACFGTHLRYSPSFDRSDECPDRSACEQAFFAGEQFSSCKAVECTRDDHCGADEYCRNASSRGGCRVRGTCEKRSAAGEACVNSPFGCIARKCVAGLQCVDNVCV